MKSEDKIVERLTNMVKGQDVTNQELKNVGIKVEAMNSRLASLEKQMAKNNIQIAENSRAILTLADKIEVVVAHEKRSGKLERKVFS